MKNPLFLLEEKSENLIFNLFLFENKEEIYNKFYSDIDREIFIKIISADIKTKIVDGVIEQIGPYSKILLNIYRKGDLLLEDLPKAEEYLELIYKHQIPVQSGKIKSLSDLYNLVKDKMVSVDSKISELLELLDENEYSILFESEKWMVISPLTDKASSYLGVNTEWCTAWGEHSLKKAYRERTCRFQGYNNQGPLYIIINKNDESEKYQIHFESNQFKNNMDAEVRNRPNFFNENEDLKKYFFPALYEENPDNESLKKSYKRGKKYLSVDDVTKLQNDLFKDIESDLGKAIMKNDDLMLANLIIDDNIDDIKCHRFNVEIEFNDYVDGNLEKVKDNFSLFYSIMNHDISDYLYNDIKEQLEDQPDDILGNQIKSYYEKNKQELLRSLGGYARSAEEFYNNFSNLIFQSSFITEYADKYCDINESLVYDDMRSFYNQQNEILEFDSAKTLTLPKNLLLDYIITKDITNINNFDDFFENYCFHNDVMDEDDLGVYNYTNQVKFLDDDDVHELLDSFFEDLIEEEDVTRLIECKKIKKEYNDFFDKHFMGYNHSYYENNHVRIDLVYKWDDEEKFDCERGVRLTLKIKKTGETHYGFMTLDKIKDYMNMEPLFESLKFKKILRK